MHLIALTYQLVGRPDQIERAHLAPARQGDRQALLLLDEVAGEAGVEPAQPHLLQQFAVRSLAPQAQQPLHQRLQHPAAHQLEGIARQQVVKLGLRLALVEGEQRLAELLQGLLPVIAHRLGLGLAQEPLDLAYAHPPLQPAQDLAYLADILLAVEAVPLVGAGGLHQTVAALPGTQGDGIDPGEAGDLADGVDPLIRFGGIILW
ncbi:hypothetical protein D3C86_728970 [compost metagenome]